MLGIVSKPQFDTDFFKVGKAIHIKKYAQSNGYKLIDSDAIISESTPLGITVIYMRVDGDKKAEMSLLISIDEIVKEEVEITGLKEDKWLWSNY